MAGAIGPLGIRIEPWGRIGVDEAEACFREQVDALVEGGVDLFVLETFRDVNEIGAAIAAIRAVCDLPIVAQMTTEEDGNSLDGTPPEQFVPALEPRRRVGHRRQLQRRPRADARDDRADGPRRRARRLSAQPNAGRPRDIEGRNIYLSSPEYLASYARRFVQHGVRLVGGCCGTTPEHIRQIRRSCGAGARRLRRERVVSPAAPRRTRRRWSVTGPARGEVGLARALPEGRQVMARRAGAAARGTTRRRARGMRARFAAHGVDAVTVSDGLRGGARMSALSLAVLVQQAAGIEPVLQYACRDRYLLGCSRICSGAHAIGIRNLVLFTGDPASAVTTRTRRSCSTSTPSV